MTTHPWVLCPACRCYVDRCHGDVSIAAAMPVRCPWCAATSVLGQWLEAGARDLCACGCPRAAHVGYATVDGAAPSRIQRALAYPAPCIGCGCARVSGAGDVRLD